MLNMTAGLWRKIHDTNANQLNLSLSVLEELEQITQQQHQQLWSTDFLL